MPSKRDEFPTAIREVLAKRAGQRCSNPDCRIVTSGPHENEDQAVNVGVAAHLTAASAGGPRYNPDISPEDRSSAANGIWLCQKCAKLIDSDTVRFPETQLVIWKRRHEEAIKWEMLAGPQPDRIGPGSLTVSAAYSHYDASGSACIVDFRVSNHGSSDLMINAIEFSVLECLQRAPLGHVGYSQLYDLDISSLQEYLSSAECRVAQILKPGEADRFGIVLSAPKLFAFAGWRLGTAFKTDFGTIEGPEIECWLPRPNLIVPFREVTQHIRSEAERAHEGKYLAVSESEPRTSGGFRSVIVMDVHLICYYGEEPLVQVTGLIPYSEFVRGGGREDL